MERYDDPDMAVLPAFTQESRYTAHERHAAGLMMALFVFLFGTLIQIGDMAYVDYIVPACFCNASDSALPRHLS